MTNWLMAVWRITNSRGFVAEVLVGGDTYAVVADRIPADEIMAAERVRDWLRLRNDGALGTAG